jgi:hypothetical protein
MDVAAFVRLLQDCGLADRGLSRVDIEAVFLAVKQPGATHLAYTDFLVSLDRIGETERGAALFNGRCPPVAPHMHPACTLYAPYMHPACTHMHPACTP